MLLSDAHLRLSIGANIIPPSASGDISGLTHIGRDLSLHLADATVAWAIRINFYAEGEATIGYQLRELSFPAGACQQAQTTVVSAAGATSAGLLTVTLTSARLIGSPLVMVVPLTPAAHPTAASIAAHIAAKLRLTPAASFFSIMHYEGDAQIGLVSLAPYDNDPTLNLAITAGLGVAAAASTINWPGAGGVGIEFLGDDRINKPFPKVTAALANFYSVPADSPNPVIVSAMSIEPGESILRARMALTQLYLQPISSTGPATIDIIFIGK